MLDRIAQGARTVCAADLACLTLGDVTVTACAMDAAGTPPSLHEATALGAALAGLVADGQLLRIDDAAADSRLTGPAAAAFVRVVLYLANRARRPFTARDEALVTLLADHAALARGAADEPMLDGAAVLEREARRREQLEALAAVSREMVGELELDRLLALVVDQTVRLAGDQGAIYLLDGDRLGPHTRSHDHVLADAIPVGVGVTGHCAARREGLVVNDYPDWPEALPAAVAGGERHLAAQPLLVGDELLGVIAISRVGAAARPFTMEDLELLQRLAGLTSLAMRNARLYDDALRGRRQAEALSAGARLLIESLDLDQIADRIVEAVLTLTSAYSASVRLQEADGSLRAVGTRGSPLTAPGDRLAPGEGVAARALRSLQPV